MIQQLAEKYWKGECTAAEEQLLKDSLRYGKVPAGLEDLAAYLRFQEEEQTIQHLDASFDEDMLRQIAHQPKRRQIRLPYKWSIAAAIALVLSMMIIITSKVEPPTPAQSAQNLELADTFNALGEAFPEVKKVLLQVSASMNEGIRHLALLGELDKQKQLINSDIDHNNKK